MNLGGIIFIPMTDHESLDIISGRITPALTLVVDALSDALPTVIATLDNLDWKPDDDPALLNNMVRHDVRERLKPVFEELSKTNANMSPVHLHLGPYQVRLVHAREGAVPPPGSQARSDYYASNDHPSLVLNVFPPDAIVVLEPDQESFSEYALLLLWDSDRERLTQFTLCRPFGEQRHELLHLLVVEEAERDLDEIERKDEGREQRTGTENGDEPES